MVGWKRNWKLKGHPLFLYGWLTGPLSYKKPAMENEHGPLPKL